MLYKTKTLKGYKLDSLDGEIGRVKEFYFDDQHWAIRYLVVDTGNWLAGRQVLISPYALLAVNHEEQHIGIDLTKKQIEDSPSPDSDKPVSRQFEATYHAYYGWPIYWGGSYTWGGSYDPYIITRDGGQQGRGSAQTVPQYGESGAYPTVLSNSESLSAPPQDEGVAFDDHLRSTKAVSGYHVEAADGPIGHIEDFIIDDQTWAIRYLIIDTVNWWPGEKVLVAARWIERVSWGESKVFINLTRAAIKQAPEYTDESLLNRDYETKLHGHYNRQGYWVDEAAAKEHSS